MASQTVISEDVTTEASEMRDDLQDLELMLQSSLPEEALELGHLPISLEFSLL